MRAHGEFLAALFDPSLAAPGGARFAVYRNNVIYGLMQNLRDGFPLLLELLGDARFDTVAAAYARAHPPQSPLMFAYGERLPDYIHDFAPLAELPYAGDVARLDVAMRQAAQAADHKAVAAEDLAQIGSADKCLELAPTLTLIKADWPLYDIYLYLNDAAPPPQDMRLAQLMMIYRMPTGGLALELLSPEAGRFLAALQGGQSLADAAAGIAADTLTDMLQRLALAGLITKIK